MNTYNDFFDAKKNPFLASNPFAAGWDKDAFASTTAGWEPKFPRVDAESLTNRYARDVEKAFELGRTALDGVNSTLEIQSEFLRGLAQRASKVLREYPAGSLSEQWEFGAAHLRSILSDTVNTATNANQVIAKTSTKAGDIATKYVADALEEIGVGLPTAAKAPGKSASSAKTIDGKSVENKVKN